MPELTWLPVDSYSLAHPFCAGLKYVVGAKGILVTTASLALPRTTTFSSVSFFPYFLSTYPMAMFFFRLGLKAPLVISPTYITQIYGTHKNRRWLAIITCLPENHVSD